MAKYRIKIKSISDYDGKPWYHLEEKSWLGFWVYKESSNKLDYLEKTIEAMGQDPVYYG